MSMKHKFEAYRDLLARYRGIFSESWKIRKKLDSVLLTETEAEFLPASLSLQAKPVSPTARLLAKVMVAMMLAIAAWSLLGKVDIIVNAQGKIIPAGYTKSIESIELASVKALYVHEGQTVKAGDVLMELDASATDAETEKARGDYQAAKLDIARSKAIIAAIDSGQLPRLATVEGADAESIAAAEAHMRSQYRDYVAKLRKFDGDIAYISQALPLAIQEAKDYAELENSKDVSHHAWIEKQKGRVELEGELAAATNQKGTLIEETRKAAYDQIAESERLAASSRQDAARIGAHGKLLKLVSPVDGTVEQLTVHTVAAIVEPAKPIMLIVPIDHHVSIEAMIENRDAGFIQEGQRAQVKVDAFDYTKYGTIPGEVQTVSRDAIDDEKRGLIYATKIALSRDDISVDGKARQLNPGMAVNVEIKTGERRIIEYVLSPLVQHARESLGER